MTKPFDYVNDILYGKKNLIVDAATEKEYVPFLANKSLSYQYDCVMFANEISHVALYSNFFVVAASHSV